MYLCKVSGQVLSVIIEARRELNIDAASIYVCFLSHLNLETVSSFSGNGGILIQVIDNIYVSRHNHHQAEGTMA